MGSLMVAPIISGAMAENVGWRNFWWLNVALTSASFIMVLFLFPETKYARPYMGEPGTPSSTETPIENEKSTQNEVNTVESTNDVQPVETADRDPWLGRGGPSKQQWKLFQSNAHPVKSIIMDLWLPWKLFAFPIAEFASFVVSWSCSSFLTLNLTQTQNFAAPPYLWSSQSIG